jgi:hypothetical protein
MTTDSSVQIPSEQLRSALLDGLSQLIIEDIVHLRNAG